MLSSHILFILFAVVSPIAGYLSYRRLLARLQRGGSVDRAALYASTMATQWILFALFLVFWTVSGREWSLVGVQLSLDLAFLVAVALTIATIAGLISQLKNVMQSSHDQLQHYSERLGAVEIIIPRTGAELRSFQRLSVTAGIVEEVLWRGFLLWYLSHFLPLWQAAVLATLAFGVAHAYQGWRKVPQITLVGATFTVLYLMTGSLLLPIILHIAVDMLQGRLAYEIVTRRAEPSQVDPAVA